MVSPERKEAYQFLLCAAMAHLKLDLAFLAAGRLSWWNPLSLRQQVRQLKTATCRAYAFHNLAWFLAHGLARFDEDHFWREIEQFQRDCPDARFADYPSLFQRKLAGDATPHFLFPQENR